MRERLLYSSTLLAAVSNEVPEGRLFALDGQTFIGVAIQIFNVVVLFAILLKLLYRPVKDMLAKRQERIESQFKEAALREQEAQALIAKYEGKLANIDEERQHLINTAKQEAEEERKRIIARAEKEAEKIKRDAGKGLETERLLLQRNAKDYVLELSTLLAEKTLKDSVSRETLDEQFEESLKQLEVASWQD